MAANTCPICGKSFSTGFNLGKHMKKENCRSTSEDVVSCSICNKRYPDANTMEAHCATEHPTCLHCNKRFRHKSNMKDHLVNKMCQERPDKDIPCPACSNLYANQKGMLRHFRSKHPEDAHKKKRLDQLSDISEDAVYCSICNKRCPDASKMEAHCATEHPTCPRCNKRFQRKYNLKAHLDNKTCQERGDKDIPCPACSKLYANQKGMLRHFRSKHPEDAHKKTEDAVYCSICNKGYPDASKMEAHCATEHPTCPRCNKRFQRKYNLKAHLDNKTCQERGDKNVPCPVCGKLYASKEGMVKHFRSKHPEDAPKNRPYRLSDISELKCCGRKFANGRALGRHRNQVHYRKINDGTGRNYDDLPVVEPPTKLSNICVICGKAYPSRLTLIRHEMEDHDELGTSTSGADEIQTDEQEDDPYSDVDSQSDESQSNDTENSSDEAQNPLDDPNSLFRRIGVPIMDKAGRKTFNTTQYRWSFRLTKTAIDLCEEGFSMEVLRGVIKELFKKISKKRGRIQIKLISDYLDYPIVMPLFKISSFDPLVLLNYIECVLSSKDRLAIDKPLTIEVTHIGEMEGGVELNPTTFGDFLRRRNGCWDPGNVGEDYKCLTYCLAAWILIGKKRECDKNFTKAKFYKDPVNSTEMLKLCKELTEKAEVDMNKKCGVAELEKYQRVFSEDYDR